MWFQNEGTKHSNIIVRMEIDIVKSCPFQICNTDYQNHNIQTRRGEKTQCYRRFPLSRTRLTDESQQAIWSFKLLTTTCREITEIMFHVYIKSVGSYNSFQTFAQLPGNLVVKSKLPPRRGSSLEAVEPHP